MRREPVACHAIYAKDWASNAAATPYMQARNAHVCFVTLLRVEKLIVSSREDGLSSFGSMFFSGPLESKGV